MEISSWFLILPAILLLLLCNSINTRNGKKLPPGPSHLFSLLLLTKSPFTIQSTITSLKLKYGPILTLSIGTHPHIIVSSHSLSHQLLVHKAAIFSDRPKSWRIRGIAPASYGPTWRLFRNNLASTLLHPSNVKSYSSARKWVLRILIHHLQDQQKAFGKVKVIDFIQTAMLRLSLVMCFGEKLDEGCVNEIARVQSALLSLAGSSGFNAFIVSRWLAKTLFRTKWKVFEQLRKEQTRQMISLIKSRMQVEKSEEKIVSMENRNGGRKLTEKEMVSMCSELLLVTTETTTTSLQWIMANLVKHPRIQSKLYDAIVAILGPPPLDPLEKVINEEDLHEIPYLKAVVLEGRLRRHPPGHLLLPHSVSEEVEVHGYKIPKGATINFMVAEMGWDAQVWDDPMEFWPERFLSSDGRDCVFDIAGSKGIKMMPFGAGRRICPGADLAMLHLKYFVANLVWHFHWNAADGYEIDLKEKVRFTVVMDNPLQTKISLRTEG